MRFARPSIPRDLTRRATVGLAGGAFVGREDVPAGGATVPARHFVLTGGIARDLWYDADCALVRIAIPGRDGVPIVFERL